LIKIEFMKPIVALLIFALITNGASGQEIRGGFGHGYFGAGLNLSPAIQRDLRAQSLLGSDLQLNRVAVFGGGGGYGVVGRKLLLGGSGVGFKTSDATERGEATISTGGGFINFGYLTTIKNNSIAYPYVGIGGNGIKLNVKNSTGESMNIGNQTIGPGESIKLNSGGLSFEAGYAFKFLTFSLEEEGSHGGLMLGIQAGTYIFTGLSDWRVESTDDMIPSFSRAYSFSPYIRLTIGGGGFGIVR
jgi:hypothetical protein